ncbi:TetR/AcrR family transcriptional regulator [Amycolatopsis sp. FDAARGOS 1241]|uniref:TetR/AcrR family transcriptional regulator n=1 Tax=Amycolatopsis sp. FDAARGOS 1241 TaxID=2778070 RepID=UPI00194F0EE7|nr:TetR/AcrR family transcriptional regulator [Amycolatopsis sp. FDAARGOS 1241]QRP46464.1 TetR/AcrR family transcriptional regulator [Amycolatopsis sp. FDAARGOS 1241]
MTATRTARERARAELTQEIKDEARRQLAEVGAHGLSLRAVARELGMVSSALYRYFPSRDRLLTELVIDAYDAVGEAAEKADPGNGDPRVRWSEVWHATRAWAKAHPHEYALIYGSPIPGYEAPRDTVVPAARVAQALVKVLLEADPHQPAVTAPMSAELRTQAEELAVALGATTPPEIVTRLIGAWTQLFGAISFELFGQYVGSVDPTDAYFEHLTGQMADFVGL